MKVSSFDTPRDRLFYCQADSGRRLLRSLLGAMALAFAFSLLMSGFARDVAFGQTAPVKPTLRATVAVPDAIVTIGDFFDDAGDKASTPLFRAPDLGTSGAVPARRVVELARNAGLIGADTGGLTEVEVSRLSRPVEAEEMSRLVATEALRQNGRGLGDATIDDLRVAFEGSIEPHHADLRATAPVRIASFSLNPQNGRFDALFLIDQGNGAERLRLRGEVFETVQVVTLSRQMSRGDVVTRDDVVVERLPRRQVGSLRAADPDLIVGMAARRQLRPGQPLTASDFIRPIVVNRGDSVTVVFEGTAFTVSSRGQAQDSGSVGDMVGVINPQSKRVIHATVAGPGKLVVASGSTAVASIGRTTP